jgi:trk system potassium uptake protein TrkA
MKVIVCDGGQVGYNIVRYLAGLGSDVMVIDQRPELTWKIGESLDIPAIIGFASSPCSASTSSSICATRRCPA